LKETQEEGGTVWSVYSGTPSVDSTTVVGPTGAFTPVAERLSPTPVPQVAWTQTVNFTSGELVPVAIKALMERIPRNIASDKRHTIFFILFSLWVLFAGRHG
jgi:hypothetical protein